MDQKTLTPNQVEEVALAVLGIKPDLGYHDPGYASIRVGRISQEEQIGMKGIIAYFQLIEEGAEQQVTEYKLQIGFNDNSTGFNASDIWLSNRSEASRPVPPLNKDLVANLLVKWGVWLPLERK